jgi:opacity protein-like surface antigen
MHIGSLRHLAGLAVVLVGAGPALAADLYLAGDIGISWLEGDGTGTNDVVGITNSGSSKDTSPVYGGALGIAFPLDAALPWRLRMPGSASAGDGFRFPDWEVRFEVEHLRGRDFDLATRSFNTLEPYRADVESWSVMGKLRLDVPLRTPVYAALGRVPFFDPLTIYLGGGAGLGETDLHASTGLLFGSDTAQDFAWQAIAGFGYALNQRVKWSFGWRFYDLGEAKTPLVDSTQTVRGRYSIDLEAHEFTTSLSFVFWRLPFLGE